MKVEKENGKMKTVNKYIQKKLNELDNHPEKNKIGKFTQQKISKIVKIVLILFLILFFIYLCYFRVSYTQKIRGYS